MLFGISSMLRTFHTHALTDERTCQMNLGGGGKGSFTDREREEKLLPMTLQELWLQPQDEILLLKVHDDDDFSAARSCKLFSFVCQSELLKIDKQTSI